MTHPPEPDDVAQVVDHLFRHEAGKMVAILTRIFGIEHLTLAEDVVQEALVRALQTKRIAGAGLDVFEREPQLEAGLSDCENAVLAPHLGSATIGTRTRMGIIALENLLAVCAGQRPLHCVNAEVLK